MKISVLVVTYNCQDYLEKFLEELTESLQDCESFEILINDNNSVDQTIKICEKFSQNSINKISVYSSENVGFAKANNFLINKARYDNILLLNPDVFGFKKVTWDTIDKLWDRVNPCFVRLYNLDGTIQSTVGDELSFIRVIKSALKLYKDPSFSRNKDYINVESGIMAFVMLSKRSINKVGLISEDYYMYGEDHDWFIRARKKGYSPVYLTNFDLIHTGGASAKTRWKSDEEKKIKLKTEKLVIQKNFKGVERCFLLFINEVRQRILT